MFSHASVILFTIGLMDTQSLLILVGYSVTPSYSAVSTHPTGMFSCFYIILMLTKRTHLITDKNGHSLKTLRINRR